MLHEQRGQFGGREKKEDASVVTKKCNVETRWCSHFINGPLYNFSEVLNIVATVQNELQIKKQSSD